MIIIILTTILFTIATVPTLLYFKKAANIGDPFWKVDWEMVVLGVLAEAFIALFLLIPMWIAIGNNIISQDIQYEEHEHTREVLEYRINNLDTDVTGNELLYREIVEFNNDLRYRKKWGNNPWTDWMYNQRIVDEIDYIEIPMEDN